MQYSFIIIIKSRLFTEYSHQRGYLKLFDGIA